MDKTTVDDEWILDGSYEIEVEGRKISAKVHFKLPYDPDIKRMKM